MAGVEAVELRSAAGSASRSVLRQLETPFVRVMLGTARVGFAGRVELDMRAEHVRDRPILHERDCPLGARAVGADVVDEQATRKEEIAGEQ